MSRPASARAEPLRRRSSILYQVVGVLLVTLVVSTLVTAVIASRLTSTVLSEQARRIATSQLTVLLEAFADRESTLVDTTRSLADRLAASGLDDPARRTELITELSRAALSFDLDVVRVLDPDGTDVEPPAGAGTTLAVESIFASRPAVVEPGSRLLPTTDGRYVQAVAIPIGSGRGRPVLVGGYLYDDAFAYTLRRRIGSLDNVVLVASGRVAGSTLPSPLTVPPGQKAGAGDDGSPMLPDNPAVVDVGDEPSLVAYSTVGRTADDAVGGAIGVALSNPISPLQRSLAQARVITSIVLALVALGLGWLLFRALVRPLGELADTAERVAGGDAEATFGQRPGNDEIGTLARSLEHMRTQLRDRMDLITRQAADLRESSKRIVAAQDEERQRLARDLHDGIQQQLVVLRMQLGMMQDGIGPTGGDPAEVYERLGAELDRVIEQLREATHTLYPSILVDRGLAPALHTYVGHLPVSTAVRCDPDPLPRLDPGIESGAYFLVGEAVTNALKHADASRIEVELALVDGWLRVRVIDDGSGFDPRSSPQRGGLLHMEDRVRSFGGDLTIVSAPGAGTTVTATFPPRVGADATAAG